MKLSLRLVSIISCILLSSCLPDDICSNTIDSTMVSPNGKRKIVMFDRDCGATTGNSTQISLLSASKNLSNISGNIFVSDRGNVKMQWLSDKEILITYPSDLTIFSRIDSFSDVSIRYNFVKRKDDFDSFKTANVNLSELKRVEISLAEWSWGNRTWNIQKSGKVSINEHSDLKKIVEAINKAKGIRSPQSIHNSWMMITLESAHHSDQLILARTDKNQFYISVGKDFYDGAHLATIMSGYLK